LLAATKTLQQDVDSVLIARFATHLSGLNDLRVIVSKGQIIPGGLFKKSVLKVKISTTPSNWKTERSLDDFKWLHHALKSRFPMNYIMDFPTVSPSEDRLSSDEFYLTGYLMHILQSPELLYSQELEDFLKLDSTKFAQIASVADKPNLETCHASIQEA
jgi:PX domain